MKQSLPFYDLDTQRPNVTIFLETSNTAVPVQHNTWCTAVRYAFNLALILPYYEYYKVILPSRARQRCFCALHKQDVLLYPFTTPEFGFNKWSASRSGRFTHGKTLVSTQYEPVGVGVKVGTRELLSQPGVEQSAAYQCTDWAVAAVTFPRNCGL
jgi:hypothetical protein